MTHRTFLSLTFKPWSLSFGIHLLFFTALLIAGRNRTLDLTPFNLDLISTAPQISAVEKQTMDEEWQSPTVRKPVIPPAIPKPNPEPQAAASQGTVSSGESANPVRSISQVSQLPRFIRLVKAQYPQAAKRAGIEGVVILQVDIDATGAVKKVELKQGLGYGLDEAAIVAVQNSLYTPAYVGNEPVPVRLLQPYRFKLED